MNYDNVKKVSVKFERILPVAFFTMALIISFVKIWDTDTFWHLKAGEVIASENRLPATDNFSYTKNGEQWINDEWLGDYFLFSRYQKHGVIGLQITVSLIVVFILWLVYQTSIMCGSDSLVTFPFLLCALLAARSRMTARPEILSLLLMCGTFFMLNRILIRDSPVPEDTDENIGKSKIPRLEFVLIPVLQALWANVHPGSVFSLLLIATAVLAAFVSVNFTSFNIFLFPSISPKTFKKLLLVLCAAFLASAMNPYGLHAIRAPFDFAGSEVYLKYIAEWAPIPFKEMLKFSGSPVYVAIPLFIAAGIISIFSSRKKLNLFHILIFVIAAIMTLKSRRFVAILVLLSTPFIAASFTIIIKKHVLSSKIFRTALSLILLTTFVLCAFRYGINDKTFQWGTGFDERSYPAPAIQFVKDSNLSGNMFNTYSLGGPLIWGLYPDYKVFSDGRVPVYGPDFYNMIMMFEIDPTVEKWNKMQSAFGFTFAILKRERTAVARAVLTGDGNWRLVFWDDYIMIFAKNISEHSLTIANNEYTMISPDNALAVSSKWPSLSSDQKETLMNELVRNIDQSPKSLQAIISLVYIYFIEENYSKAETLAEKGLSIAPGQARLHAVLGEIYLKKGDNKKSSYHFEKAKSISKLFKTFFNDKEKLNDK